MVVSSAKFILLAGVALAVSVSISNCTSLILGNRVPGDNLACLEYVDMPATENAISKTSRHCYLPAGNNITYIHALDRGDAGQGGFANIVRGGLNLSNVTVLFQSQLSQSINFTLSVYSKESWFNAKSRE